ncbi:hypothetical protein [Streptomyces sp. NPDC005538]|uniref:hypothetical protein n=1 Tax=Streptomyces sp. NPDC005538 TaxID=3157043 RepID=UPI0033B7F7B4
MDLSDDGGTAVLTEFGRVGTADVGDRPSHREPQVRQPPEDDFADADWVMWRLEVSDPGQVVAEGLADRTAQSMTELAGTLGCVYSHCVDYDSMDGTAEGTYYAWYVRVPQAEHQRRGPDALPVAVITLQDHLRSVLPDALTDWRLAPDGYLTGRVLADAAFKDVYADVIAPLEVALLGLRRDGAEKLDPDAQMWAQTEDGAAATYALWLCKNPDDAEVSSWLVLYVGYLAGPEFWDSPLGQQMRRFGVSPGQPVLTLPRPGPVMWVASAETLPITPGSKVLPLVGVRHQWTARDGQQLADRVKRDLRALLPGF